MKSRVDLVLLVILSMLLTISLTACGDGGNTPAPLLPMERVSVNSDGEEANDRSRSSALSADGRYIAFFSNASDLVVGDTNGAIDVFVHDRQTGATTRVSVDSVGVEANGNSVEFSMSEDGRYVAFHSAASNLVAGDTNGVTDIFVHDRQTGVTTRVSIDSDGVEANGSSTSPSISADGRYVAFQSVASNLVAGDTKPAGQSDVFVHDRQTGATTRVSVDSNGVEANGSSMSPSISADGRYVAFTSIASNLVAGDYIGKWDIFVHDRQTGATTRVSVDSAVVEANGNNSSPSISADGRYVAFVSYAKNLVAGDTNVAWDVFAHDRQTGATTRVSVDSDGVEANGSSMQPSISANGRYVAFGSDASNLVAGDTNGAIDVFVHDRETGATTRVSVDSDGVEANNSNGWPSISADGRYVAFSSTASNLVAGDTNTLEDVFLAPNK